MKRSLFGLLFISTVVIALTSCTSTAGLSPSQVIGAKNSPAALMSVYVSNEVAWETGEKEAFLGIFKTAVKDGYAITPQFAQESAETFKAALETGGGFEFVYADIVKLGIENAIKKDKKAKKATMSDGSLFGFLKSVESDAEIENSKEISPAPGYYNILPTDTLYIEQVTKAAKKNKFKTKSYIYGNIEYGLDEFKTTTGINARAYCSTSVYITDKDGWIIKEINALAFSDLVSKEDFLADPAVLTSQLSDLMKKSTNLAASNLDKKVGLFDFSRPEMDTKEFVSNGEILNYNPNREMFTQIDDEREDVGILFK